MKILIAALFTLATASCSEKATEETQQERPVQADNTKKNEQEKGPTPVIDQGESQSDITITAAVRRELMQNHDLSVKAQNVKIITKDGVVTLRGPVESDHEKAYVRAAATSVPEVKTVDDQLEVTAN